MPSSFTVLEATPADVPGLAAVFDAAFQLDAVVGRFQDKVDPAVKRAGDEKMFATFFEQAPLTGARIFKAMDEESGEIIGLGKWLYPITLSPAQTSEKAALDEQRKEQNAAKDLSERFPPGTNGPLKTEFLHDLDVQRKKYVDPTRDFFMHILVVSPARHREGVGKALLARGLSDVDAQGAKCYIEASPMGLPVYLSLGWEIVDEVSVDLEKYGIGKGVTVRKNLMRAARAKKEGKVDEEAAEELEEGNAV